MINENTIKIVEYEVLGKLPDPFLRQDGTRVSSEAEWYEHRNELYKTAVELQFGTMPPKPEIFEVEMTYEGRDRKAFTITAGTKARQVSIYVKVFFPKDGKPVHPTIIDGDLCFNVAFTDSYMDTAIDHNILYALFDRTQLAHDLTKDRSKCTGNLCDVYPEYTFSAIGAWAWGYSRVLDALIKLGWADTNCIAFTGHSRGGKTALLAGALDERATIVNPNDSGCGGCGCFRVHSVTAGEDGWPRTSETLKILYENRPDWFNPQMKNYIPCEEELPFDEHYLKAMVAPRILLDASAASDGAANPVGTWQTAMAATEVYKFLGKEENLIWYFRSGHHEHKREDLERLINVMEHTLNGEPLFDDCFITPFKKPELIFDWRAPEKE